MQRLAHQRDALHPAAGDDQLAALRPPALQLLLAFDQVLAHARRSPRTACTAARRRRPRARAARRSRRPRRSGTSPGWGSRRSWRARRAGCRRGSSVSSSPPRRRVRRAKACAKSVIDAKGQRAGLAAVERGDMLVVVRQAVQRLAARLRGEDRALAAPDQLGGLQRRRRSAPPRRSAGRRRRRTRCRPGTTSTPPQTIVAPGAARDTVVPERGVVPRANTGSPMRAQAAHVAAEPVGDDPGQPAPARLAGEQLAEDGARAAVGGDRRARRPAAAAASALITGRWSSSASDRERRPGHPHVGDHRADRRIDHRQRLVGVRERGHVDSQQPLDQVHAAEPARRAATAQFRPAPLTIASTASTTSETRRQTPTPGRDRTRDDRPRPPTTNRTAGRAAAPRRSTPGSGPSRSASSRSCRPRAARGG